MARTDIIAGLVSSTVAIPLAMAFGMFAFVTLGDEYFAYGAMAGLISAVIAGLVCVLLGDRSTRVYAPRITTTFFLGLLLYSLLHRATTVDAEPDVAATLLVFFAIILLGGMFQALFGLMRLGTLIKFAPHPVMAGFQNMAAVLLFLVQLGNVLGFEHNIRFTRVFGAIGQARPLSLLVAALTFAAMWNARRKVGVVPADLARRTTNRALEQILDLLLKNLIGRQPDRVVVVFGLQELIDLWICKGRIGAKVTTLEPAPIAGHDRPQHVLPTIGTMDIARTQRGAFQIAELIEHE